MRLLIVDDDVLLLRALTRLFGRHYALETAAGGAAALALIRGGAVFDAILCDIHMSPMSGRDLFEQIHALLPELAARVVFTGAHDPDQDLASFLAQHPFLWKPFAALDLECALAARGLRRPLSA